MNGDYPEDVTRAMEVAFQYRNTFRKVCALTYFSLLGKFSLFVQSLIFLLGCGRGSYGLSTMVSHRFCVFACILYPKFLNSVHRGHNELDEPAFTQPRMYKLIRSRKSVPALYEESLIV